MERHAYEMHAFEMSVYEMHAYPLHGQHLVQPWQNLPSRATHLKFRGQPPGLEGAFPGNHT